MRPVSARFAPPFVLLFMALGACTLAGSAGGGAGGWGATLPPSPERSTPPPRAERPAVAEAPPPSAPRTPPPAGPAIVIVEDEDAPPIPAGDAIGTAEVTRISFADRSDGRGLVVRVHASGRIPAYNVEEAGDGQLRLNLFQTSLRRDLLRGDPRGPVRRYTTQAQGGRTTVTFELDPAVRLEARAYPDRDSNDLLLGLTYAAAPVAAAAGGATGADAASLEHWRLDCIVIDAGHGGKDPGATAFGVREKDVTLGVSLRLGRMVEEQLGIRVVYTRRDDRFIELAERGRIANQSCGKLFVSIHINAAGNASARGTETYFLGLHRSESARQVMERENSVVQLESDPSLYSGMDEAALIMQTMAQSTYLRVSEQLAGLIEGQFSERVGRQSRGVKQAGFLVLWRASMPAVLVELGFVTNREEAAFLGSDRGQDQLASALLRAIRDYKVQYERGLGIARQ